MINGVGMVGSFIFDEDDQERKVFLLCHLSEDLRDVKAMTRYGERTFQGRGEELQV